MSIWERDCGVCDELESCAFPSFPRRGSRDPEERPGWLCRIRTTPAAPAMERGPFLEARSHPSLERRGMRTIPDSLTPSSPRFHGRFIHSFYDRASFLTLPDSLLGRGSR